MPRKSWDLHDPRFWDSVDTSGGRKACWPYTRYLHKGYGLAKRQGKRVFAHRLAWECINGPVPPGMEIRHTCDNPACCNPAHLLARTHAENMAEMAERKPIRGEDRTGAKLTDAAVLDIRARWPGERQQDLAEEYGVSQMTISNVVRRARWTHI